MDDHSDLLCRTLAVQNLVTEMLARLTVVAGGDPVSTIDIQSDASMGRIERMFAAAGPRIGSDDTHEFMHRILHYSEEIWTDVRARVPARR